MALANTAYARILITLREDCRLHLQRCIPTTPSENQYLCRVRPTMEVSTHAARVNSSCPSAALPESLPGVPTNLTYIYVTSQTSPDQWMATCCSPNPVHYVGACNEWCEPPSSKDTSKKEIDDILTDFDSCAVAAGRNSSYSAITAVHKAAAPVANDRTSLLVKLGLALAVTSLVHITAF